MHICIDIQSAVSQRAGVGRYTHQLLVELDRMCGDADRLSAFYFDFKRQGDPLELAHTELKAHRAVPGRFVQQAWKRFGGPAFDRFAGPADVYHFPNFVRPPLRRGASVVTIHDVAFLTLPDTVEPKNLHYLKHHIPDTCRQAQAIITVSEFCRREIVERLDVSPARVHAIHNGVHLPEPSARDRIIRLRDRPFLLFVSTIEPRKNIPFLVKVFEQLTAFDGDLVLVGQLGWTYEPILQAIRNSSARERIHHLQGVSDDTLQRLYSEAELFVFPSLYEGFGFPPLEAMAAGTPVAASTAGSLPEVLGEAAHLIDSFEADRWTAELTALLQDSARRETLVAAGRGKAAGYTWQRCAQETWKVYKNAYDHSH